MQMADITLSNGKVQGLWNHSLRDKEFINELQNTYHALLTSNYGPKNYLTLIQNSAGSDFLTSSSQTLLQQLSFFHPCFKFINALINAQLKAYGIHGLYVGALCSGLLFRSLKLEDFVCHQIVRDVSEWIQCSFIDNLCKKIQRISCKINIGKLDEVLCIVRGIIYSKSYHTLSPEECEHISVKIVEAFLKTIPESEQKDFSHMLISSLEGPSSSDSCILNGILYSEPDFSIDDIRLRLRKFPKENLKIIIFTVPLSHDVQEKSLIEWHSNTSLEKSFTDHLYKLLRIVSKEKGINVIANQKFIHASVKYDLEKDGFLVLERLGTATTSSLVDMTGCCPISSLTQIQFAIDDHIGYISSVQAVTIGEKTYINVLPLKPHQNITFVLTGIDCNIIEFLKESINTSITLLQQTIRDSSVVIGAGCLESFAALILTQMKKESVVHLAKTYNAPPSKINMVFDVYIETFLRLSIIPTGGKSKKLVDYFVDSTFHHVWESSDGLEAKPEREGTKDDESNPALLFHNVRICCACKNICKNELPLTTRFIPLLSLKNMKFNFNTRGESFNRVKNSETDLNELFHRLKVNQFPSFTLSQNCIVDYFPAKLNAIRFAFDGFSELFRIGVCIFDK